MGSTEVVCASCGSALVATARFCSECGKPRARAAQSAEYKQVTVLFADVVHSMDLAAALGTERLREVMSALWDRSTVVVQRYGGTVDKFTGDGIMALFGAPMALEDHAFRACLAALDIQTEIEVLATNVQRLDGATLQLRVGLNSGQVIAGEIGSAAASYTAIGEQVGMAQRMESVAPPGGVMLSESTASLVDGAVVLADREMVRIKGSSNAVPARRLLAVGEGPARPKRGEPTLVGRIWELNTLEGILEQSVGGNGCVAGIVGPPGIGKSRTVRESMRRAAERGVEVFTTYSESHTHDVPFHVVARLLRAVFEVGDLGADRARAVLCNRIADANPEDLLLLCDLLGIADAAIPLPAVTPDARQRRLAALLNSAALARAEPAVYVIEDAHWIDEASEAMLAEFVAVVPQTRSLVLITYRPEYQGALSRTAGGQTIALAPLSTPQTSALVAELLGEHPSVTELTAQITEQAVGNPFFAEEITRDLAGRGVLDGERGHYTCHDGSATIALPSTLQATLAARIDRLEVTAKRVLYAGAIIGARFTAEMLDTVMRDPGNSTAALDDLVRVELVDQVRFTPHAEYGFRHPLVRTVAYESQLKAERAELHRRVAAVIEQRDPDTTEQNAALIAEHLEAAGDLAEAFGWRMRAGAWSNHRDLASARTSWQRAGQVANRLPDGYPARVDMQIQPRTLLCATAFLAGHGADAVDFEELRELCAIADDKVSLAIGMSGVVMALAAGGSAREASDLADEFVGLLESTGDPTLQVALFYAGTYAKMEAGEARAALQLAQRAVDLADGDPKKGNLIFGSPLAMAMGLSGFIKMCLGIPGWQDDADIAIATAAATAPEIHVMTVMWKYVLAVPFGAVVADARALGDTEEALSIAERTGDQVVLGFALVAHGFALLRHGGPDREKGIALLTQAHDAAWRQRFVGLAVSIVQPEIAREKGRNGDLDGAVELGREAVGRSYATGEMAWRWSAVTSLVEALVARGGEMDVHEAEAAIDRLAAVPTDEGFVLHELPVMRLRALVSRTRGDEAGHDELMARLRDRARALGFEALAAQVRA